MKKIVGFVSEHRREIFFGVILIIVVATRFVPINSGNLSSDNALNSFRAYGWLDYFGTTGQTTPIQWFGNIPTWAMLSFHDAPPLAFFIQRIFFLALGGGTVVARLPFVIAGIGSIFLVYYLLKKLTKNSTIASVAAVAYSVSSLAAWSGQAAYLEGIEEFFIVGSVLVGAYVLLKEPQSKLIYVWAMFVGLALLTKYTAIFLIPPIIIFAFLYRDEIARRWKRVILSIILLIVLLSPIIIYNIEVYQTRGHFDAALSSMIGMRSDDFTIISDRVPQYNVFKNAVSFFQVFSNNMSYPFFALVIVSFIVLAYRSYKTGWRSLETWILVNIVCAFVILGFVGASIRFMSIMVPLFVISIAIAVHYIYKSLDTEFWTRTITTILVLIFVFELIYSLNTNVLNAPIGASGFAYSGNRIENLGFNQLDSYIRKNIITQLPSRNVIRTRNDFIFSNDDVTGRSAIIYDDKINWTAQMWYFQRYFLYHSWPIISTAFISKLNENMVSITGLMEVSGKPLYFIYPLDKRVIDPLREANEEVNSVGLKLVEELDSTVSATSTIIYDKNNIPMFKIYKLSL